MLKSGRFEVRLTEQQPSLQFVLGFQHGEGTSGR